MLFKKLILGKKTISENCFYNTLHIDDAAVLEMSHLNYCISFPKGYPQFLCFHPCSTCHMFTSIHISLLQILSKATRLKHTSSSH